jgi:glycosyltransferase involved in cell wall biosynthesis
VTGLKSGLAVSPGSAPSSLHLGNSWFPDESGGLNRYLRDLLAALDEVSRAEAVVVGPAARAPDNVTVVSDVTEPLARRLQRFLSECRRRELLNVVDSHFALYSVLPLFFAGIRRRPLVVHFQGPWADEGKTQGDLLPIVMAKRFIERRVYSRAREAIVLSHAFGRVLVEAYGVSPWRVSVVHPGTDLSRFTPGNRSEARKALAIPESTWVAVAVRRLVPRMGLDVLLDAWATVETDDRLLMVAGGGPMLDELRDQAARRGLSAHVRFVGDVKDDALLADCYRAADVCVVPSVALEGFGIVILEALACGTPVIVTDVGGLPEAVSGLTPGDVVRAGDAVALGARLRAAADGSRPLPSSRQCRSYAEQFSWPRIAQEHLRIYRRALRPARGRRLRVVYLGHTANLSGAEIFLLRLLPALDDVDAHVILAEDGPLVARLLAAGISVEVLPWRAATRSRSRHDVGRRTLFLADGMRSGVYAARVARRLRKLRPDIVHTNSLKAALYGGLAGRLSRTPVVWHVHDRLADDYLGKAGARLMRRASCSVPDAVIANSRTTFATLGSVSNGRVIGCPVVFGPRERTDGALHPLSIGMVGRIAPWKGQRVFIEAFARAFPEGQERAVIVGAPLFGEEDVAYEHELRDEVHSRGLAARVAFRGFREDVETELARLDILVHASVLPEPFGQVVAEGMAAGLAVVASDAGGPQELIEDGRTGLLYPPGDAEALAEALRRLAADTHLRSRLGAAAREYAVQFSPQAIAQRIVEVYDELLGVSPAGPSQ